MRQSVSASVAHSPYDPEDESEDEDDAHPTLSRSVTSQLSEASLFATRRDPSPYAEQDLPSRRLAEQHGAACQLVLVLDGMAHSSDGGGRVEQRLSCLGICRYANLAAVDSVRLYAG